MASHKFQGQAPAPQGVQGNVRKFRGMNHTVEVCLNDHGCSGTPQMDFFTKLPSFPLGFFRNELILFEFFQHI